MSSEPTRSLVEPGAGELNRRVTIRRRLDLPAADLGLDQTFPETRKRWAKITPAGAATYAGSAQIGDLITHRVIIRYLDGITDAHEVVHGVRVYRVKRVTDMNGGHRFTMLDVEELQHGQ